MISPSRPERNDEPPTPGLKVRRSEALEEARRRSRPRDISSGTKTLGPSSECGDLGVEEDMLKTRKEETWWTCKCKNSVTQRGSMRLHGTSPPPHLLRHMCASTLLQCPYCSAQPQVPLSQTYLFSISLGHTFFAHTCTNSYIRRCCIY